MGIARNGAFGLLLVYATAMPLLAGGLVLWALRPCALTRGAVRP